MAGVGVLKGHGFKAFPEPAEGCADATKQTSVFMDGCISNVLSSAPEAQCLLAPRFSVGNAVRTDELRSPGGTAQGHLFCKVQ